MEVIFSDEELTKMRQSLDAGLSKSRKIRKMPVAGSVRIFRKRDSVYLFGVACAAVLNRVNEIDSTKLFDDFVYRNKIQAYKPDLLLCHDDILPVSRLGTVEQTFRVGYTYVALAKFDLENPYARMVIGSITDNPAWWGMSVGYIPYGEPEMLRVKSDQFVEVYTQGFNHEISLLPEEYAASHFTGLNLIGDRL